MNSFWRFMVVSEGFNTKKRFAYEYKRTVFDVFLFYFTPDNSDIELLQSLVSVVKTTPNKGDA